MNKPQRVYVAHAYSNDPAGNCARIREICRGLIAKGYHPVAPQLWLDQLFDEATQREEIMEFCLDELASCSALFRFTPRVGGVATEYAYALVNKIPVVTMVYE